MDNSVVVSGLVGTFAMTIFIELICFAFKKPFHVIRILARVLQFTSSPEKRNRIMYWVATVVHYSIGVLFTYSFKLCVERNLLQRLLIDALIFGAIAGTVGILGWRIAFALHPSPPKVNLRQYLSIIWIGHLVFALGQFYSYVNF